MADDFAQNSSLNNLNNETQINETQNNQPNNTEALSTGMEDTQSEQVISESNLNIDSAESTATELDNEPMYAGLTLDESFELAGGKDSFDKAIEFVQLYGSEELQTELTTGLNSDNKDFQKQSINRLMENYRNSPNYHHRGKMHGGENSPMGLGDQAPAIQHVSQRELAEGLRAEMKSGAWDGTDANATPVVNKLRRGFLALRKHRQASPQSRNNVI